MTTTRQRSSALAAVLCLLLACAGTLTAQQFADSVKWRIPIYATDAIDWAYDSERAYQVH